ncbi:MAG: hypothetical protein FE046_02155 [Thermoplasmata archaeon]|nr:MAG: hypothetical protein FE046_02155 [Thermoplasmata archaeon]
MDNENILRKLSPADSFTILNGIFGLFSIFLILGGEAHYSFIFILLAVLADGMDGVVARKHGGYLGRYIDEFADIVSFCVAPCIFAYARYDIQIDVMFFAAASLYLIGGILHLINYHFSSGDYFMGITTPAAAIILVSTSYLLFPLWSVLLGMVFLAVIMLAPLSYPRIERLFAIAACIIIFSAMTGRGEFILLLLVSTILYAVLGPVYMKLTGNKRNP